MLDWVTDMNEADPPKAEYERLKCEADANEASRLEENTRKTQTVAEKLFPYEKFVSGMTEIQPYNKFAEMISVPQNVKIAISRIPINTSQFDVLQKELRQAETLARLGN